MALIKHKSVSVSHVHGDREKREKKERRVEEIVLKNEIHMLGA